MPRRRAGRNKERKLSSLKGIPYELRGRIWLDGEGGTFLGHGRVVLMERIVEHGSISRAARSMGMSYRHAWRLVDSMNRQAPCTFVTTSTGGRNGGGATVTEQGRQAIETFWKLNDEFRRFLESRTEKISFCRGDK